MNRIIHNTLETAAVLLNGSENPTDKKVAAILYTVLGSYQANNIVAIDHIAQTAIEEAQAFVLMHDGNGEE